MGVGPASVFTLFWLHVVVHAPASVSCHLIGNAGISREWYDFTLQADYLCIFLASTLLSFTLSFWVFPPLVTLGILLVAVSMTVHLVRATSLSSRSPFWSETSRLIGTSTVVMGFVGRPSTSRPWSATTTSGSSCCWASDTCTSCRCGTRA